MFKRFLLRHSKRFWAASCIALTVAAILLLGTLTPSYQSCVSSSPTYEHYSEKNKPQKNRVAIFLRCEGAFVDANNGTVLAFITVALVWLGYLQLHSTRVQSRAFIIPISVNSYWVRNQNGTYDWRIGPLWENSGNSPTRGLRIHSMCHIRDQILPFGFNFDYPTPDGGSGIIAPRGRNPGGQVPASPGDPISAQEILDAQHGRKFIYMYGWARYHDVFGTREHITRYCWLITFQGDPLTFVPNDANHPLKFSFVTHFEGNCVDDECG